MTLVVAFNEYGPQNIIRGFEMPSGLRFKNGRFSPELGRKILFRRPSSEKVPPINEETKLRRAGQKFPNFKLKFIAKEWEIGNCVRNF